MTRCEALNLLGDVPANDQPKGGNTGKQPAGDAAEPPHDQRVGDRVRSLVHVLREDGSDGGPLMAGGTVVELRPPAFGLPAGVAVVRPDGGGGLFQFDVTALLHEDGRPVSPLPFVRDPDWGLPPDPPTVVNAIRPQIRTGDAEARLRWARLLARCRRQDHALARALRDLRRQGAALEPNGTGCTLAAGRMEAGAYSVVRERELAPRGQILAALLNRLGEERRSLRFVLNAGASSPTRTLRALNGRTDTERRRDT